MSYSPFRNICAIVTLLVGLLSLAPHGQAAAKAKSPELMLWVKAEDLKTLADGDRVSQWVDASGQNRDVKAIGEARPTYRATGNFGKPTVVFEKKAPPLNQEMLLPLSGEWSGATVFVVGQKLANGFWFESLPGLEGDLRVLSFVQLAGNKMGIDRGFPDFPAAQGAEIATLRVGIDETGAMRLTTYAAGKQQATVADPTPRVGVGWRPDRARIGSEHFEGAIAEVLVYRGALLDLQRMEVERYLMGKYGVGAVANAPATPVGFPVAGRGKPTAAAPPATGQPIMPGLRFWMRADELKGLADNAPLSEIPNAVGGPPAQSEAQHKPSLINGALNGRNVVRFRNDYKSPREEVQWLQLPRALDGSWPELSFMVAGRKLLQAGVLDTAPGQRETLRYIGPVQHSISALTLEKPFPFFAFKQQGVLEELRDEGQVSTLITGKLGAAGQYITTFADGHLQARSESPTEAAPVLMREAYLGTTNRGETRFEGEMGEVLLYDRALTDAERQHNEAYLAKKWGVPLRTKKQKEQLEDARSRWSLRMPILPHTQSWFANTLSGRKEDGWVQSGIADLTAMPDGSVAAISIWDEQHKEIGFYKDGKALGGLRAGGGAIATDGRYLYAAMSGYGKNIIGVRRLTLDLKEAHWPNLPVVDFGAWGKFPAISYAVAKEWTEVRGLAVGQDQLYLTIAGSDDVRVHDAATGAAIRTLPVKEPGKLAVDKNGVLWVATANEVISFTKAGQPRPAKIPGVIAGGLALDPDGMLWVAEAGERQQLIAYDISGPQPREGRTIGQRGGVFSGPRAGQLTDNRILPPRGLAVDGSGNFVVLGLNVMRAYNREGAVQWTLECTAFTTTSDIDPGSDGNVIYTGRERYDYQPGAPAGKDWKLSGFTNDTRRYPELAEGGNQTVLRKIDGHLLRYSPSDPIVIHRQQKNSDIFIPAGLVVRPDQQGFHPGLSRPKAAPPTGRFVWNDLDGDGLVEAGEFSLPKAGAKPFSQSFSCWIDTDGGIWEPMDREGIRYLPLQKVTAAGVPIYDLAEEQWFEKPKEFMQVMRVLYLPRTDTMLVTGTTWDQPARGDEWWGTSGREIIYYADWKKPTRKILWRSPFPEGSISIKAVTVAPAANLFFAGEMDTMAVFAYDLRNGRLLGMVEPSKQLIGDAGWIDIDQGIRAFTRASGEVLLLSEEVWGQKQMVYRIRAGASNGPAVPENSSKQ